MRNRIRRTWKAAIVILAAAAPAAAPKAAAQEGPPSVDGAWAGSLKGKVYSLEAAGTPQSMKAPFAAAFTDVGGDLSALFSVAGDPPLALSGASGNGHLWLAQNDAAEPILVSAHANRMATALKGTLLKGDGEKTIDVKLAAKRDASAGPAAPALGTRRLAKVPPPSLSGAWSGKASGKRYSLVNGVKPSAVKAPVTLTAAVEGNGAVVALTIRGEGGDEVLDLAGKAANGVFWAFRGGREPVLVVGTTSGREPRAKAQARLLRVGPDGVDEIALTLKRSRAGLRGTAAAGAPIAGVTVTLKDRHGTAVTAVTGDGGVFTMDAAGLTPPFLLRAGLSGGGWLYGVATEAGVANLHPLTDLILRTWYEVMETDIDAAFAGLGDSTPMPTALEVELLEGLVRRSISKWLTDRGLDPADFDLIQTPFAADGTGFDAILDDTVVNAGDGSLTVTDGTTTQQSSFTCSAVSGTVTVDTTVTSGTGTSESRDGTTLTGGGTMEEAVASCLAAAEAYFAKVNSRGAALRASDLAPFLTPDFLEDGQTTVAWTAEQATFLRGMTAQILGLQTVRDYDEDAGTIVLVVPVQLTLGDYSQTAPFEMFFGRSGSAWLLRGDQRIADVNVGIEFRTDVFSWGVEGPRKHIEVYVGPPTGTVQSVTISGGGLFDGSPVPKGPQTRVVTYHPTPTTDLTVTWDMFNTGVDVTEFPDPGTEFQITVTPFNGPPQVYTVVSRGTTTEQVQILEPTGTDLATDGHPGTPITVRWTPPQTFAVERLELSGSGYSEHFARDVPPDVPVSPADSEGSVTIPTTAGGETVTRGDIWLSFDGVNGERIVIVHGFD